MIHLSHTPYCFDLFGQSFYFGQFPVGDASGPPVVYIPVVVSVAESPQLCYLRKSSALLRLAVI
jgi:hypothetical protein